MITSRVSKPAVLQKIRTPTDQQEQDRLRKEFVAQIKKEVESSTYEVKSQEIADKVSQRIREEAGIPKIFLRSNRY